MSAAGNDRLFITCECTCVSTRVRSSGQKPPRPIIISRCLSNEKLSLIIICKRLRNRFRAIARIFRASLFSSSSFCFLNLSRVSPPPPLLFHLFHASKNYNRTTFLKNLSLSFFRPLAIRPRVHLIKARNFLNR